MRKLLFFAAVLVVSAAHAETAYVTDMLQLGLHKAADASDQAFDNLPSGTAVNVLKRDGGFAQVTLTDGREGWVKSAYLVTEKPARLQLAEIQDEMTSLRAQLKLAEAGRSKAEQDLAQIRQSRAADQRASVEVREARTRLKQQNDDFAERLNRYRHSLPLPWVLAALPLMLILGFVAGWWWLDASIRQRHGGFRVY
ncbi:MAG TPA: TIGR04211 family SH3 domain-containing protein [Gammaproteobacteria bacterium]|nr:TIGR04211 family SH3 domain-containing protein [Gammaproteobacteria bacterium]